MALIDYDSTYKDFRKLAHPALNPTASKKYAPYQERIAWDYMRQLSENPHDFLDGLRLYVLFVLPLGACM